MDSRGGITSWGTEVWELSDPDLAEGIREMGEPSPHDWGASVLSRGFRANDGQPAPGFDVPLLARRCAIVLGPSVEAILFHLV